MKTLILTHLILLTIFVAGCSGDQNEKNLDVLETKVFLYSENSEKFLSKPDRYRGPDLPRMLDNISDHLKAIEQNTATFSEEQKKRLALIRECLLTKKVKKISKRVSLNEDFYITKASETKNDTPNKANAESSGEKTPATLKSKISELRKSVNKDSKSLLEIVNSERWKHAENICNNSNTGIILDGSDLPDNAIVSSLYELSYEAGSAGTIVTNEATLSFDCNKDEIGGSLTIIENINQIIKQNLTNRSSIKPVNVFLESTPQAKELRDLFNSAVSLAVSHDRSKINEIAQLYFSVVNKLGYLKYIESNIKDANRNAPAVLGFNLGEGLDQFIANALEKSELIDWKGGVLKDLFGPTYALSCQTIVFDQPMQVEFYFVPSLDKNNQKLVLKHWKLRYSPNNHKDFKTAINEFQEAARKSSDALDKARLLETISKLGLRDVVGTQVDKANLDAIENGNKMLDGLFGAINEQKKADRVFNEIDQTFEKFLVSRAKNSSIVHFTSTTSNLADSSNKEDGTYLKTRLFSKERGRRMTVLNGKTDGSLFISSATLEGSSKDLTSYEDTLTMYRVPNTGIFESKSSCDAVVKAHLLELSGGDECHMFKSEVIYSIAICVQTFESIISDLTKKNANANRSFDSLNGTPKSK